MFPSLRYLAALTLAAFVAFPLSAQDDRERDGDEADDRDKREVVIERDGNVYRFRVPDDDALLRHWRDGERPFRTDTVIDGRRVIRFRPPGGEEETFELEVPDSESKDFDFEDEAFRRHVMPELERFRVAPPDLFFEHDGEPFGLRLRGLKDDLHGLSDETRREMMELERRTRELASEARRAEGREREEAERALDEALEELFEVRGRVREERATRLEERAERLREEAEELRQSLRERERARRALIEERKRELLGEPGADW